VKEDAMAMSVKDVMNRFVIAVQPNASFTDVVTAMCRFHVEAVPVVDSDRRVVGLISDEDLLLKEIDRRHGDLIFEGPARRVERRKASGRTAAELMTSPAITVTEDTELRRAALLMYKNRVKQLPVVDCRTGKISGLVRQADLIKAFCRPPEDIRDDVLKIVQRYSRECAVKVEDGVVFLSGSVDRRSLIAPFLDEIWKVDGVVDVTCDVSFMINDLGQVVPRPDAGGE
jgi:CBS-domain-containing membrane protein